LSKHHIDINRIIELSEAAGKEILSVYNRKIQVEYKDDQSPLTEADKKANSLIKSGLKRYYPDIPILSEEDENINYSERKSWERYWLVDPLDGTKEFIKRNGEFTVNIAFMEKNRPIAGVVYAPARNLMYYAEKGKGSFVDDGSGQSKRLAFAHKPQKNAITVVGSRSHPSREFQEFVKKLKDEYENVEIITIGSSLKICLVAEGKADIYPRLGPTMEWDTAAAHVIANGAGKKIYKYATDKELVYNKECLRNDWFIVK
jgi:3'(2'), 5'-bisphosphate nucleotidase